MKWFGRKSAEDTASKQAAPEAAESSVAQLDVTDPVLAIRGIVSAFEMKAKDMSKEERRQLADETFARIGSQFTHAEVDLWMMEELGKGWVGGGAQ